MPENSSSMPALEQSQKKFFHAYAPSFLSTATPRKLKSEQSLPVLSVSFCERVTKAISNHFVTGEKIMKRVHLSINTVMAPVVLIFILNF